MSTGHRTLQDLFNSAMIGAYVIADPGNGNQINVDEQFGVCHLTIAASGETRTLPSAASVGSGVIVTVVASILGSGDTCTIEGVTLSSQGDLVSFITVDVNGTLAWKQFGGGSVAGIVPLSAFDFRVHDAPMTHLPTTPANDDLGVSVGTYSTSAPALTSVDFGGTTTTAYARYHVIVPPTYIPGAPISCTVNAHMQVVSDDSATLDLTAYRLAAASTDICATAAQSINVATSTNEITFTITPTNVVPGDILDCRFAFAGEDDGDASANIRLVFRSAKFSFTCR